MLCLALLFFVVFFLKKACSQERGGSSSSSQQGFRTQLGSSFPSLQRGHRGQHRSQIRKRYLADSSGAVKPGSRPQIHLSIPAFSPDQAPCNCPAVWYLLVPVPLHWATLEQQNRPKKTCPHRTVALTPELPHLPFSH